MATHVLKTWPGEWEAVRDGRKLHEIREADRDFRVGDTLILQEFVPSGMWDVATRKPLGKFTDRAVARQITYITPPGSWGLAPNLCVLSIRPHT